MSRPGIVRLAIFLATVVASWAVLSVAGGEDQSTLTAGEPAPRTYSAQRDALVVDELATEAARQEARDAVDPDLARERQPEIEATVAADVDQVFDDLEAVTIAESPTPPVAVTPELPTTTTTTADPEDSTTTTEEPLDPSTLTGRVFIDVDGDGLYVPDADASRVDQGIEGLTVSIETYDGPETVTTAEDGSWSLEFEEEAAVVSIQYEDPAIPNGFVIAAEELSVLVECGAGETCETLDVPVVSNTRAVDEVARIVAEQQTTVAGEAIDYLSTVAVDDVIREALGEPLHLPTIRQVAQQRVLQEFGRLVTPEQLTEAQASLRTNPPAVFHLDTGPDIPGGAAAGEIVATFLQANYIINNAELIDLQEEAASTVPDVEVQFVTEQKIVEEGDILTPLHIAAIAETTALTSTERASFGLLAVVTVLVGLLSLYLARFRPEFWARPRMVALIGIMVLLAAASVRLTVVVHESTSWYVLPAVVFGFVTAVLFDQRIGLLMAFSVGVLTAAGTLDVGITAYGVLAAMAPIPFVSSVSTRGAFRRAVIWSSLAAAVIAVATSWFFHAGPSDVPFELFGVDFPIPLGVIGSAAAWAFGVSVVVSLVGLAALQFFESAFDVTTTLSLLDLTDRNHEALMLLQEEAFGSFNHSLMVGTLADAAARAIGANPLLARAMAYYHDLGKTENPLMFIENQFGIPNPHDSMDPKESAEIIRSHVTAGVALARQFKIPTDVTQGIVSHHGDGVMRYFYEKARGMYGDDVDIDDFRHVGHKPRTEETAILMLADALEASCRAIFQSEEPTPDAIEKVVDRIMDEKLDDGQLSESPLTLGELTKIRAAFLESLVGHYHQRIAYPNFPGS